MSTTSPDRHVVTGVLVAHEGAQWLPETLKALLTQTRPVQRLVAVDTGSRDRGPAILTEVMGEGNLLCLPRTAGYGEAVAEALRHPAATLPVRPAERTDDGGGRSGGRPIEWIWLLHDDCAPAPGALEMLLAAAGTDPGIAVLGPKIRDWYDRRLLIETGVKIDGAGRRETGLDRYEFDQGQHDGIKDVLAVGSAGMLVRKDVWDELGGFDVGFGLFREDVDFAWRAHAAGHRVVVAGDAVAFHAEAAARGRREIGLSSDSGRRIDRRNALHVLLGNLPAGAMLRALVRNIAATLLRALFLVSAKRPDVARDELAALGDVLRAPGRLRRMRAARAHNRKRVHRSVRRMMAHGVVMRRVAERTAALLSPEPRDAADEADDVVAAGSGEPGLLRRVFTNPGVVVVLALAVTALAAERSVLLAAAHLGGGALVPARGGASDLWAQYLSGWHPVGLGSEAPSPPYVGVLAVLSTLTFGKPWAVVALLLLGSVPLAGLTAYVASRALLELEPEPKGRRAAVSFTRRRIPPTYVRAWIAATYALLPAATGAIAGGRLGTALVIVLLPLLGLQGARMFGLGRPRRRTPVIRPGERPDSRAARAASSVALLWDSGRETPYQRARRAAWGFAFLLTIAMAFVPLTWLLAVIMGALAWVAFGGSGLSFSGPGGGARPGLNQNLAIGLGLPALLLLPWTIGLLLHPSRFLLEAGLHRPGLADAGVSGLSLLTLDPGGPGEHQGWALYGLLLVAVLALPLRSRRAGVLTGWLLTLFGLLVAVLVSAAVVTKGADQAPAWPGVAITFAAAGVLLAAITAVLRAVDVLAGKHTLYRAGGAFVIVAALTAPILSAATWIGAGVQGPLGDVGLGGVPRFIETTSGPGSLPRVLVLNLDETGRVTYTVLRGVPPRLGEAELPTSQAARRRMDLLVGELAAGRGAGGRALTRMGVHYVLVPREGRAGLASALDSAPELTRFSLTRAYSMWRLVTPGSRLMLVDGQTVTPLRIGDIDGRVRVPAGNAGRTLLLAEPADGGWRARLDGAPLEETVVDGWAQGYRIPASGGALELSRSMWWRHLWLVLQAAGLFLTLALALPAGRVDGIAGPSRSRGAGGRGRRALGKVTAVLHRDDAGTGMDPHPHPDPGADAGTDAERTDGAAKAGRRSGGHRARAAASSVSGRARGRRRGTAQGSGGHRGSRRKDADETAERTEEPNAPAGRAEPAVSAGPPWPRRPVELPADTGPVVGPVTDLRGPATDPFGSAGLTSDGVPRSTEATESFEIRWATQALESADRDSSAYPAGPGVAEPSRAWEEWPEPGRQAVPEPRRLVDPTDPLGLGGPAPSSEPSTLTGPVDLSDLPRLPRRVRATPAYEPPGSYEAVDVPGGTGSGADEPDAAGESADTIDTAENLLAVQGVQDEQDDRDAEADGSEEPDGTEEPDGSDGSDGGDEGDGTDGTEGTGETGNQTPGEPR